MGIEEWKSRWFTDGWSREVAEGREVGCKIRLCVVTARTAVVRVDEGTTRDRTKARQEWERRYEPAEAGILADYSRRVMWWYGEKELACQG